MKRKPAGYLVQQHGLAAYGEFVDTKKKAVELARDCLWWSRRVTITPLYSGKPIEWISKRELSRRTGSPK